MAKRPPAAPQAVAPAKAAKPSASPAEPPRLAKRYQDEIVPALKKQFGYTNVMAVPKLTKIVLNMGCGEAVQDAKVLEQAQRDMTIIAGQKPVVTRAKKAVSNFKIKEHDPVGCRVTLRRARMYEFLDRLISGALPRIRDFRGLPARSFDQGGNYSFGVKEQGIFPELHLIEATYTLGMDIIIVTSAQTTEEARALLLGFGMPFEKTEKDKGSN